MVLYTLPGLLLFGGAAFAQAGRAELLGTIRDSAGLPVAGVRVEAIEQQTGLLARTITTDIGQFHFFARPPGSYALNASKPRFATLHRTGIELRVADRVSVDLQLQVG